jgi:hypothetical protein
VAKIPHDDKGKPVYRCIQLPYKRPIVADGRMLFAEYPIVDGKFALSDKFVEVKLGNGSGVRLNFGSDR